MNEPIDSASARLRLPRLTTPTWEIELLISGALVFSLFSLREPLEDYFRAFFPVATDVLQPLVMYSYLYTKLVLFVLLITFVLHLAARARWVALVGVHSIYPQGPRKENLSGGPVARELTIEMVDSVDEAIERADNQASLVFGYGILAAQLSLMITVVSLVFFGLLAMLRLAGVPSQVELGLALGFGAFLILPMIFDKLVLSRIGTQGRMAAITRVLMRVSFAISLSRMQQPLNALITTNFGGKRGAWVLIGVIYVVLGLATFDTFIRIGRFAGFRGDALASAERDFGLLPNHYADQRQGTLRLNSAPFIDSEVIEGPYLRLTLPYLAGRHDALIASACPAPESVEEETASERQAAERSAWHARVNCFGQLFNVQLDGAPLPDLEFHRLQRAEGGPDGVMAMIDVRGLAPGRHVLQLDHLTDADASDAEQALDGDAEPAVESQANDPIDDDQAPEPPHVIEFWR